MASLLQDMDIESHVNVDGIYVPHRRTIQDILNSNRPKSQDATNEPSSTAPAAPRIGLLHKTVTRSSIVKWIFPARIRHADFNDLVFIGEDFFCVKEIMPDGRLRHVGTKADFHSKIRAAGVVGKRVEVEQPSLMEGVAPIKAEKFSPSAGGSYNPLIPPNLVVLALEDCEVMFLFADHEEKNGRLHFYESLIPFPRQNTMTRQPGNQISVDPKGRVVAISAYNQTLMLCKLKDWRTLGEEFTANKFSWCPIVQELPVLIDGSIMKLTFLTTGDKTESCWILVVLARLKDRSRLYCYEGHVATGLTQINPVVSEHPLDKSKSGSVCHGSKSAAYAFRMVPP
jgi:Mono-functional DNA-alkylating methyl methanesulfonate N-term